MADKYTYADVIIDPEDPRVELWEEYYFGRTPFECLCLARGGKAELLKTVSKNADKPFSYSVDFSHCFPCLIRKKEPEKQYVPLDLNDREDVFNLMGSWLMNKTSGSYHCVITIKPDKNLVYIDGFGEMSPEELLEGFMFVFNDSPCGKLVEEEE